MPYRTHVPLALSPLDLLAVTVVGNDDVAVVIITTVVVVVRIFVCSW